MFFVSAGAGACDWLDPGGLTERPAGLSFLPCLLGFPIVWGTLGGVVKLPTPFDPGGSAVWPPLGPWPTSVGGFLAGEGEAIGLFGAGVGLAGVGPGAGDLPDALGLAGGLGGDRGAVWVRLFCMALCC